MTVSRTPRVFFVRMVVMDPGDAMPIVVVRRVEPDAGEDKQDGRRKINRLTQRHRGGMLCKKKVLAQRRAPREHVAEQEPGSHQECVHGDRKGCTWRRRPRRGSVLFAERRGCDAIELRQYINTRLMKLHTAVQDTSLLILPFLPSSSTFS